MKQLNLNLSGKELKLKGMQQAERSANELHKDWSEKAYWHFKYWIRYQSHPFKIETFREWCKDLVPNPRSLRAFGSIVVRAKKEGLIEHAGYTQVQNAKAHAATASLWQRV